MDYQSTPKDRRWAWTLGFYYIVLSIALSFMLFKIWPPVPWPTDDDLGKNEALKKTVDAAVAECFRTASPEPTPNPTIKATADTTAKPPSATPTATTAPTVGPAANSSPAATESPAETSSSAEKTPADKPKSETAAQKVASQALVGNIPISFFGGRVCVPTSFDERLILLVIVAGMLGSFVHGATSLADYLGCNNFNRNWTWFYVLRPAIGMALALVFYFVIRGGFLTTTGGAKDINPYGIAALAGLVGMFSKQATDKLGEVFGTLFRSAPGEGDEKRKGALKPKPITVGGVIPPAVAAGSTNQGITVTGTNFVEGSIVHLNNAPQPTTFVSPTQLTAQIDDALLAVPATLKLKVVNEPESESPTIDLPVF
jgi:hypothetical protein